MRFLIAWTSAALAFLAVPVGGLAEKSQSGHLVVVWHANADDFWAGEGPDPDLLETAVLARCKEVMGEGCETARSMAEGVLAVARRNDGNMFIASAPSVDAASIAALASCQQDPKRFCEIQEVLTVPREATKVVFRDPRDASSLVRRYGAIVWQNPMSLPPRIWIASGRATPDLAIGDALANCRADGIAGCELAIWSASTTLVVFTDDRGSVRIIEGRGLEKTLELQDRICRQNGLTCRTRHAINIRAEETSRIIIR